MVVFWLSIRSRVKHTRSQGRQSNHCRYPLLKTAVSFRRFSCRSPSSRVSREVPIALRSEFLL